MYRVTKTFRFEAAHALTHLPEGHKCRNLHGHNYVVEVELSSPTLDDRHFVADFGDISVAARPILSNLDHQNLNTVLDFPPTAENLAAYLFTQLSLSLPALSAVRVWETPDAWAEWSPS